MAEFELNADIRSEHGKGAVRRLRRDGRTPAIMYGAGQAPVALKLAENLVRRQLSNEAFFSHVLTVKVDGREERAVIKSLQRHPATERILHLDLLRVSETQRLTMLVPIHFENEEDSPGRRAGGSISHHTTEVEITCLPRDLPEYLAVDTLHLNIGDSIHLSQIPLPEGVEIPSLATISRWSVSRWLGRPSSRKGRKARRNRIFPWRRKRLPTAIRENRPAKAAETPDPIHCGRR